MKDHEGRSIGFVTLNCTVVGTDTPWWIHAETTESPGCPFMIDREMLASLGLAKWPKVGDRFHVTGDVGGYKLNCPTLRAHPETSAGRGWVE